MGASKSSGFTVGQTFNSRREVWNAGIHSHLQAGIDGTGVTGARAIVVSGGYPDDRDLRETIIYTGHGGRDNTTGRQVADQSLEAPGNAALVTSHLEGLPVRVVRGAKSRSPYAPTKGYRYDGEFRVTDYGWTLGADGFRIIQFTLQQHEPHSLLPEPDGAVRGESTPESRTLTTQRIVRSSHVVRNVKSWYGGQCQICGGLVYTPGGVYSEGAHIQALAPPHRGPDTEENVLCLCPNCHVQFDAGAIWLTDELNVVRLGVEEGPLITKPEHEIDVAYIRNHRLRWDP